MATQAQLETLRAVYTALPESGATTPDGVLLWRNVGDVHKLTLLPLDQIELALSMCATETDAGSGRYYRGQTDPFTLQPSNAGVGA